jgi:trans-aconitate methyltransferase
MGQFHFSPDIYAQRMADAVPAYARLQAAIAEAAGAHIPGGGQPAQRLLELGTGTGETATHVLAAHPGAALVGIDASAPMLAHARVRLPGADLRVSRLEDALPEGPFHLVFSALAVHHLDGAGKAELFARVAAVLAPGGRFVLGDVVVPDDPADAVTPLDRALDRPSSIEEQLAWMAAAGLSPTVAWRERDLAVLVGDRLT